MTPLSPPRIRRTHAWRVPLALLVLLALAPGPGGGRAAAQLPAPAVSSPRPFHIGGYASLVPGRASLGGDPAANELTEAAAALLVSGSFGRASYFGEFEPASRNRENWSGLFEDRASELERLYLEYAFGDALRLRAGRFLTPVGQWNEIHAQPLTWTALRPLTTYRPFSKTTTGLEAAGSIPLGSHDAGYALYVEPVGLGGGGQETRFTSAGGGRLAVEVLPQLYLGASALLFRASRPAAADSEFALTGPDNDLAPGAAPGDDIGGREEDVGARSLFGFDASWSRGRVQLLSEGVLVSATGEGGNERGAERGAFLQAALPLPVVPATHLVLRAERYGATGGVGAGYVNIYTAGLTVRPSPHLTFKLDRQVTSRPSNRAADGWFVSASALF
jgi:hypothetical protein